jgi:dUTP pyrophosphatase
LLSERKIQVKYKIVSPLFVERYLPGYASEGAGGLDLHACIEEPVTILPGQRIAVPVGIAIEFEGPEVVAFVYARSGLAMRFGISLPNGVGVIDSDYRGEIKVLLTNFSDEPFEIQPGDRIAQLIFAPVYTCMWERVDELSTTERGVGGFGSTGIKVAVEESK